MQGDFVTEFVNRHGLSHLDRYAVYHALCWAENKSADEIRNEIARVNAKLGHAYQWDEVGSANNDYVREITLNRILQERQ